MYYLWRIISKRIDDKIYVKKYAKEAGEEIEKAWELFHQQYIHDRYLYQSYVRNRTEYMNIDEHTESYKYGFTIGNTEVSGYLQSSDEKLDKEWDAEEIYGTSVQPLSEIFKGVKPHDD